MNLGYHSISWDWGQALYTAVSEIAAIGYEGTETFASIAQWDAMRVNDLEQHLTTTKLTLASLYYDGALGHPGQRELHVEKADAAARLLARLGGETLVVGGGQPQNLPGERKELAKTLDAMGAATATYGITLALHPHMGCVVADEESTEEVLGLTNESLVRFCPDTAHLALLGMNPTEMITRHADRLGYLHLKDYKDNDFAPLGQGDLNLKEVFKTLHNAKYDGWVMVELDNQDHPAERAESAMMALEKIKR